MITRIVKMEFKDEHLQEFVDIFNSTKERIISFEGCLSVRLAQEQKYMNLLFTISQWENLEALNKYRESEFFITTWSKVKTLFISRAEAWSLTTISE
ncbi:MAG: antibiotic biosynthesis monooxygenase family protein [Saprospiraceae bacterium]